MPDNIAVLGNGWPAAQAALTLADLGIEVDWLVPGSVLDSDSAAPADDLNPWPLLLRAALHARVHVHTGSSVSSIASGGSAFKIGYKRAPRFVKEDICTACGECAKVCSVKLEGHTAIHAPVLDLKSVPSAYVIDKDGISPCRGGCPLEINVHGYVSLVRQGKPERALHLINQKAPLSGVLGRLCTHPCEIKCSRQDVDKPLYIQALHRYAADHGSAELIYDSLTEVVHREKIAIIGSGPAGLSAAWELARRGYRPVIFESSSEAGGMLATGIPNFRLPAEIRRREIAAIQKLGVEIRTGAVFGRDITLDSLRRDNFQALFLAIGAQSNNHLNIPGENLEGVVDCIKWLHEFNLRPDVVSDEKIVIIGGGNSAVDSARSAKRVSRKEVRILCLTAEMTAIPEETEEAVHEGIPIDYNHSALEILGENGKVTGVRCIRVQNVQFDAEGRISLERIEGSEYIVPADKVIVAIGQRPDSAIMNLKELKTARNQTIPADPLTLQTNLPGVFAGGDAVTGSRNVVSAMAAGLRAAESIIRYLQGRSLTEGRTLDPLETVQVDAARKRVPHKARVKMPELGLVKRRHGAAETSLGLNPELAASESQRCLDCAGCCECLECENVCEVKAVYHADSAAEGCIRAAGVIDFHPSDSLKDPVLAGIYRFMYPENGSRVHVLDQVSALAWQAAAELKLIPVEKLKNRWPSVQAAGPAAGISVVLCHCGSANSSVLDFGAIARRIAQAPGVKNVHQIEQSCTPEGAAWINQTMLRDGSHRLVLAACRCCDWDQVCYSCGDRRVMCRQNLKFELPPESSVEYVNIREMDAWLYRDDPSGATVNAIQSILAGISHLQRDHLPSPACSAVSQRALIVSGGLSGLSAAASLAAQGYNVTLLSGLRPEILKSKPAGYQAVVTDWLAKISPPGVDMRPWPTKLVINGGPGRFEAQLSYGQNSLNISAGCIIADIAAVPMQDLDFMLESKVLAAVIKRWQTAPRDPRGDQSRVYRYSILDTSGVILMPPNAESAVQTLIQTGLAAAARAAAILSQEALPARGSAVLINRRLCRGCGDCAAVCPLISLEPGNAGLCYAEVDPAVCLGCGMCVSVCPTGAIQQPAQDDRSIEASLSAFLGSEEKL
jgi:NADPH-dependent glutamate synthase beta subunit-like oxidoreductase/formate hydrogenlyase subunit 6/NADH:ubiquinone oxidoreductase subunit I